MREGHVASLVEFRPVVGSMTTDGQTPDTRMPENIMLLSHTLTIRGSPVTSLVKICPVV